MEIFIQSNGVHTDIVMPVKSELINWNELLPYSDFVNADSSFQYIGMGWGDKGFYLDTPEWNDLKFSTAFNAAFGLGKTAMHVTYKYKKPIINERCKKIVISKENYKLMIDYIISSFRLEKNKIILIAHAGYTQQDRFYEGKGTYNIFKTCNVWTGKGLKTAGVKIGIWTPFQSGIIEHIE
ncbi:MAG: TIGR02117 family protein [Bacteroidetes bacterium]|nr:TIGR02117 family protein [Bacteroidota bacterium]